MVSIEAQRTYIHFDGLSNVLGALGADIVARKVEGRQRPDGKTNIRGGTGDIFSHLLALREEASHNYGTACAQIFAAEVCLGHVHVQFCAARTCTEEALL